jgi:hypothetical protein
MRMERPEDFDNAVREYVAAGKDGMLTTYAIVNFLLDRFKGHACAAETRVSRGRLANWIKPVMKGLGFSSSVKYTGEGSTGVGTVWN